MATNFLLSFALVICLCAGYSAAIKCYVCNMTDSSCEDQFNKSKYTLQDGCAQCGKFKIADKKDQQVDRDCLTAIGGENKCHKSKEKGRRRNLCLCNTDGCNGASSVYFTMASILPRF